MNRRGRWILCAATAVLGGWIAASSTSGAGTYGHRHLATTCVVTETSSGPMVAARTHWQMWNSPHAGNRLGGYRWQARLVPTRPGLNLQRGWGTVAVEGPDAGSPGGYRAVVTTPANKPALDWDLQVKLTWDRADRRDWNVEHVVGFDERACLPGLVTPAIAQRASPYISATVNARSSAWRRFSRGSHSVS